MAIIKSETRPGSGEWTRLFPDNQASDQNFRMIVRPNAPGQRVRVRFSNLVGSKAVILDALGILDAAAKP